MAMGKLGYQNCGTAARAPILDLVMHHYNSILRSLQHPGEYAPIFDIDTRTDETLWEIWIDGLVQAMNLAPEGWQRVAASGDSACDAALAGIETLRACASGEKKLTPKEQGEWDRQAPDLIPIWVEVLHQWRVENDPNRPAPARRVKVGRNDPCPCGSGKKYNKCCGLN